MIKMKINIAFLLLLFTAFVVSCEDTDETLHNLVQTKDAKYAQVAFNVSVPLSSLPSSRAISNDTQINDYVVWVFNNNTFVEAITPGTTYTDDEGNEYPKISYDKTNGGRMYLMLSEELTAVRLMMVANVTAPTISEGTTIKPAKTALQSATFTNDANLTYMPMCGENNKTFAVTHGADGGTITLIRAMAKVEVRAIEASDHFTLSKMYVYQVNSTGTIAAKDVIDNNSPMTTNIEGTVDATNNLGYVYLPEIADVNADAEKTFVILEGTYTDKDKKQSTKFYRLDFIKRTQIAGSGVSYSNLENIQRNHRYIFEIDYLTATAGHATLNAAIAAEADNKILDGIETMVIDDVDVMDITTDNYIYLGVTAGNLTAYKIASGYYAVRIRVVTNNSEGWTIETLPANVSVTMSSWTPTTSVIEEPQSVWVYIEGTIAAGQERTLYIYSGNIRKSITITTAATTISATYANNNVATDATSGLSFSSSETSYDLTISTNNPIGISSVEVTAGNYTVTQNASTGTYTLKPNASWSSTAASGKLKITCGDGTVKEITLSAS